MYYKIYYHCVIIHNAMSEFDQKRIDLELKSFTHRHFERPAECRNAQQIRFYVQELCARIEVYEKEYNYAPGWAYTLLAQYNGAYNRLVHKEFVASYC